MLAYLASCFFLLSQITTISSIIYITGVATFDINSEDKSVPDKVWYSCMLSSGGACATLLLVFVFGHRGLRYAFVIRQFLLDQNFQTTVDGNDLKSKASKIRVKYPLFLVADDYY